MQLNKIDDMARENRQNAVGSLGDLTGDLSFTRFIEASACLGSLDHYKFFSPGSLAILDMVRVRIGDEGLRAYLGVVGFTIPRLGYLRERPLEGGGTLDVCRK